MSTVSVSLTPELENFVYLQIQLGKAIGKAKSKSELVRRALQRLKDEEFIKYYLAR
jgi:Arc/MetJ-type ribon-helix-helix transcriptional regulator